MADDLDELDALLNRIPRLQCPQCGTVDLDAFTITVNIVGSWPIESFNPRTNKIHVSTAESLVLADEWHDYKLVCTLCDKIIMTDKDPEWERIQF